MATSTKKVHTLQSNSTKEIQVISCSTIFKFIDVPKYLELQFTEAARRLGYCFRVKSQHYKVFYTQKSTYFVENNGQVLESEQLKVLLKESVKGVKHKTDLDDLNSDLFFFMCLLWCFITKSQYDRFKNTITDEYWSIFKNKISSTNYSELVELSLFAVGTDIAKMQLKGNHYSLLYQNRNSKNPLSSIFSYEEHLWIQIFLDITADKDNFKMKFVRKWNDERKICVDIEFTDNGAIFSENNGTQSGILLTRVLGDIKEVIQLLKLFVRINECNHKRIYFLFLYVCRLLIMLKNNDIKIEKYLILLEKCFSINGYEPKITSLFEQNKKTSEILTDAFNILVRSSESFSLWEGNLTIEITEVPVGEDIKKQSSIIDLCEKVQTYEEKLEDLNIAKQSLKTIDEKNEKTKAALIKKRSEVININDKLEASQEELNRMKKNLREKKKEQEDILNEFKKLSKEFNEITSKNQITENSFKNLQLERDEIEKTNQTLINKTIILQATNDKLQEDIEAKTKVIETLKEELKKPQSEIINMQSQILNQNEEKEVTQKIFETLKSIENTQNELKDFSLQERKEKSEKKLLLTQEEDSESSSKFKNIPIFSNCVFCTLSTACDENASEGDFNDKSPLTSMIFLSGQVIFVSITSDKIKLMDVQHNEIKDINFIRDLIIKNDSSMDAFLINAIFLLAFPSLASEFEDFDQNYEQIFSIIKERKYTKLGKIWKIVTYLKKIFKDEGYQKQFVKKTKRKSIANRSNVQTSSKKKTNRSFRTEPPLFQMVFKSLNKKLCLNLKVGRTQMYLYKDEELLGDNEIVEHIHEALRIFYIEENGSNFQGSGRALFTLLVFTKCLSTEKKSRYIDFLSKIFQKHLIYEMIKRSIMNEDEFDEILNFMLCYVISVVWELIQLSKESQLKGLLKVVDAGIYQSRCARLHVTDFRFRQGTDDTVLDAHLICENSSPKCYKLEEMVNTMETCLLRLKDSQKFDNEFVEIRNWMWIVSILSATNEVVFKLIRKYTIMLFMIIIEKDHDNSLAMITAIMHAGIAMANYYDRENMATRLSYLKVIQLKILQRSKYVASKMGLFKSLLNSYDIENNLFDLDGFHKSRSIQILANARVFHINANVEISLDYENHTAMKIVLDCGVHKKESLNDDFIWKLLLILIASLFNSNIFSDLKLIYFCVYMAKKPDGVLKVTNLLISAKRCHKISSLCDQILHCIMAHKLWMKADTMKLLDELEMLQYACIEEDDASSSHNLICSTFLYTDMDNRVNLLVRTKSCFFWLKHDRTQKYLNYTYNSEIFQETDMDETQIRSEIKHLIKEICKIEKLEDTFLEIYHVTVLTYYFLFIHEEKQDKDWAKGWINQIMEDYLMQDLNNQKKLKYFLKLCSEGISEHIPIIKFASLLEDHRDGICGKYCFDK